MSFKFLVIPISFLSLVSCGVKSDPVPPQDTLLPSYEAHFTQKSKALENEKGDGKSESEVEDSTKAKVIQTQEKND